MNFKRHSAIDSRIPFPLVCVQVRARLWAFDMVSSVRDRLVTTAV